MNKETDTNPLVSICMPVLNGGSLIQKALDSAVSQTYKNIEIIVVDNDSDDNTADAVLGYAKKDSRIRYLRNPKRIGPYENFLESFRPAKGKFSQLLACDDWLSRNHIEEAVKLFNLYPDTAAVFTKYVSFDILKDGELKFNQIVKMRPGNYSADFFLRNIYRTYLGYFSIYAMLRTEDMINATSFTQHYFANPPRDIRPEFQSLCRYGFGVDIMMFQRVIPKYKYFTFAKNSAYIKTEHPDNYGKKTGDYIRMDRAVGILHNYEFFRTCHEFLYKTDFKEYLSGLRVFLGKDTLASMIVFYVKKLFPKDYFEGLALKDFSIFFRDYSLREKTLVFLGLVPLIIKRSIKFLLIRIGMKKSVYYGENLFLDKSGNFKI